MKIPMVNLFLFLIVVIVVAACGPSSPETKTSTPPPDRMVTTSTPAVPATATPDPVSIAPLPMQIGSEFYFVDGTTLVAVPAGEFWMGGSGMDNPRHKVTLKDFWIYSTKVTNQQYALCEKFGRCTSPDLTNNPGYLDRTYVNDPVVGVTYDQARDYCGFVNGRLPTEAEWEKSARYSENDIYPWGNSDPSCDLLNFNECIGKTTNVINYLDGASGYGALDMAGNAFEWVADWFDPVYYAISSGENPQGPASGTMRSVRSSSYASAADQVSVVTRNFEDPKNHRPDLGFRCVVEDPTHFAPFCQVPSLFSASLPSSDAAESCPSLDIQQAQFCNGKLPATNVKFIGPSDSTIDPSNCVPSDDPNLFTCQTPGTIVSITAACQIDGKGNPFCPLGYSQEDEVCIPDGGGGTGQCLAGDYDPSRGCCVLSAKPESLLSISSICPAGTFYAANDNACLPYPVQGIVTVSLDVEFNSCSITSGGGGGIGGDGGTSVPPTSCAPKDCGGDEWSTTLCCCTFYFDPNSCIP